LCAVPGSNCPLPPCPSYAAGSWCYFLCSLCWLFVADPHWRVEPLPVGLWKAIVTSSLHDNVDRELASSCGFLLTACFGLMVEIGEPLTSDDAVFWWDVTGCFCVVCGFTVALTLSVSFWTLLFCVVLLSAWFVNFWLLLLRSSRAVWWFQCMVISAVSWTCIELWGLAVQFGRDESLCCSCSVGEGRVVTGADIWGLQWWWISDCRCHHLLRLCQSSADFPLSTDANTFALRMLITVMKQGYLTHQTLTPVTFSSTLVSVHFDLYFSFVASIMGPIMGRQEDVIHKTRGS